ncbi:NADH-quinone oxidoreductase subunit L [Consotaella salsifontis]|uniref:NADH dehydrogenase subunit L n=1 Tax=Consotaella salsifontis TaxID=1365950 RepID=A0A1T4RN35_9HYPH|nr:proton-conducting transporter membrane subunit [Consotaella salsifontis]SKA17081.1 NADH dehydrogenase subunit L [Consotaella salsifontis]
MLFLLILPPILAALAVPFAVSNTSGGARGRLLGVALVGLAGTLAFAFIAAVNGWAGMLVWARPIVLTAALTPISAAMAMLVPLIALPILAYATFHEEEEGLARLVAFLLLFVAGMELLVIAADLLTLLIGWELVGACSYLLIGHEWREEENPASGLYAFLVTRLGDLGLFVAAIATFAATGSFSYAALGGIPAPLAADVAFGLILSAAAKSGQVPFSPWLFRAMAGPTSVSALLHAATMVAAGAYILIQLEPFLASVPGASVTILGLGLATALAGGMVAVLQIHAKKLLAASTSAHFGLMFVAIGAGFPGVAFLHLAAHAAFKALLFLGAGIAGSRAGTYSLDRMSFGRVLPWTAVLVAVGALSLAGLPPLGGGWTKEGIVTAGEHVDLWIAAGVIAAGALSAAYAARFALSAFDASSPEEEKDEGYRPGRIELAALAVLAVLVVVTSLLWLPLVRNAVASWLNVELPEAKLVTFVLSTLAVLFGGIAGAVVARRHPGLGREGDARGAANWLGLPALIDRLVTRPAIGLAKAAAAVDDWVIDAMVRAIGKGGRQAGRLWSSLADVSVDSVVAGLAAATSRVASLGGGVGERLLNGLADGTALMVGQSGRDARRIQTGLSHHYYALAVAAGAVAILFLLSVS